jgi:hypothetical protein
MKERSPGMGINGNQEESNQRTTGLKEQPKRHKKSAGNKLNVSAIVDSLQKKLREPTGQLPLSPTERKIREFVRRHHSSINITLREKIKIRKPLRRFNFYTGKDNE